MTRTWPATTTGLTLAEVNAAAATVDSAIGRLVEGLKARGIEANLVIVADHGMAGHAGQ